MSFVVVICVVVWSVVFCVFAFCPPLPPCFLCNDKMYMCAVFVIFCVMMCVCLFVCGCMCVWFCYVDALVVIYCVMVYGVVVCVRVCVHACVYNVCVCFVCDG